LAVLLVRARRYQPMLVSDLRRYLTDLRRPQAARLAEMDAFLHHARPELAIGGAALGVLVASAVGLLLGVREPSKAGDP
jgi:hypothetical protein